MESLTLKLMMTPCGLAATLLLGLTTFAAPGVFV